MANQFGKTRPQEKPYAIYRNNQGWEWRVLKTYKTPKSEAKDPYARWFVAAKSPMTFGSWELGDTYKSEVMRYGRISEATPEFYEAYKGEI